MLMFAHFLRSNKSMHGFGLVELMVAIAVLGILASTAVPSFNRMIQDTQTRTFAESLQNALRLTQAEAVKQGLQVQFFLTDDSNPNLNSTPSISGKNWGIVSMDLATGLVAKNFIQGATLAGTTATVAVSASNETKLVRFNSIGRVTSPAKPVTYEVTNTKGSRKYNVVVALNGAIRMCDPDKTRSSSAPDGC